MRAHPGMPHHFRKEEGRLERARDVSGVTGGVWGTAGTGPWCPQGTGVLGGSMRAFPPPPPLFLQAPLLSLNRQLQSREGAAAGRSVGEHGCAAFILL